MSALWKANFTCKTDTDNLNLLFSRLFAILAHMTMKVLVVEDEEELREILCFFFESKWDAEVEQAGTGDDAITLLTGPEKFDLVACDYNMPRGNGGKVFQFVQTMAVKPKFILLSSDLPEDHPEIILSEIAGYAPKPLFSAPLESIVQKIMAEAPVAEAAPDLYCRVSVELLHKLNVVPCDLYIKISDQKMIKVMNAGDVFGDVDAEKYQQKKVAYLFIDQKNIDEVVQKLIRAFRQLEKTFDPKQRPPGHIHISEALQGTIHEMATKLGFSAALESLVKANMETALAVIDQNPDLAEILSGAIVDTENYLARHSVLMPFIAAHFAELMEWQSSQTFQKLIIASFLHDATISDDLLAKVQVEAELAAFTPEQAKVWQVHTLLASEIARQFTEIPPDVDQIIAQHHELPDGTGSPNHLNHTRIAPLAALFIIAQDFLLYFENTGSLDLLAFTERREAIYTVGQFKRILVALKKSQARA